MARANPLQPNFNAGELSERMAARVDFSKFKNGVEIAENVIALAQGGLMRRPGTRFVKEVKDSTALTRLKRFEFSTTQAYILEMGNNYIRFYRNQGQIVVSATGSSIGNGDFTTDITGWTDQSNGTGAIAHDATNLYMDLQADGDGNEAIAEQNIAVASADQGTKHVLKFRVRGIAGDTIRMRIGSASGLSDIVSDTLFITGYHTVGFTPIGAIASLQFESFEDQDIGIDDVELINDDAVEIGSPWSTTQLFDVEGPQSADTLYMFHEEVKSHKLTRTDNESWSLTEVVWVDGPYFTANSTAGETLAPSANTGVDITILASGHSPFKPTDVGRLVRISNPASGTNDWGDARIVSVESGHSCTADVIHDFSTTNASTDWRLGSWNGVDGYPSTGTFFEQRLYVAGSAGQPQTWWASQTADFENHTPDNREGDNDGTVADDDALDFTLSADEVNAIRWLSPGKNLVIGTTGGEWTATSDGSVITPTDVDVKRKTKHGSARVQPVRIGTLVLFLQKAKRKIRQFGFDFASDSEEAFDMNRLADTITKGGITEISYQQDPHSTLWCVRADGQVPILSHLREEEVVGWTRTIFGGVFGAGDAVCESTAAIPGVAATNSEDRDEVWVIIKREVNGLTKRYVEFVEDEFEPGDDQEDAFFVDSGLTYSGSAITTIAGFDHLEGQTVSVWANGAIHPNVVVLNGQVTLQSAATKAQIGLPYQHKIKSLRLEAGARGGTALGKVKRISGITLVVVDAHTAEIGPDTGNLIPFDFRQVSDPMDAGAPLFTGEKFVSFNGKFDTDTRVVLQSSAPAPFTLIAAAPEIEVNEAL